MLLVIISLSWSLAEGSGECGLVGDCKSLHEGVALSEDMSGCLLFGKVTPGTLFVSWDTDSKICVAYSSCDQLDETESTFITSSVECTACHGHGECLGHVVDEVILGAEESCLEVCQSTDTCSWFTFFADLQICLLMTDCPRLDTECSNCYSSQRECGSISTTTQQPTTTAPREKRNRLVHMDGDNGVLTLVTLDGSAANCELPQYPYQNPAALVVLEDSGVLAGCGGYALNSSNYCFALNGSTWVPLPGSERHCLLDTNSIFIENKGWWLSGLVQSVSGGCSAVDWSSEILGSGSKTLGSGSKTPGSESKTLGSGSGIPGAQSWSQGPPHPRGYSNFSCIAEINATHTLFTPGEGRHPESWIYNWNTEEWMQSSASLKPRKLHGCALLPGRGVLIAGGQDENGNDEYSVELFDPVTQTWSQEPDLVSLGLDPRQGRTQDLKVGGALIWKIEYQCEH